MAGAWGAARPADGAMPFASMRQTFDRAPNRRPLRLKSAPGLPQFLWLISSIAIYSNTPHSKFQTSMMLDISRLGKITVDAQGLDDALAGHPDRIVKYILEPNRKIQLRQPFSTSSASGVDPDFARALSRNVAYHAAEINCCVYHDATILRSSLGVMLRPRACSAEWDTGSEGEHTSKQGLGAVDLDTLYNPPDESCGFKALQAGLFERADPNGLRGTPAQTVAGLSVLAANRWADNYRHWHSECIPAILAAKALLNGRDATWIVPRLTEFQKFSFDQIGIPRERILELGEQDACCERLLIVSSLFERTWVSGFVGARLKEYRSSVTASNRRAESGDGTEPDHDPQRQGIAAYRMPPRRLYVSRRDSSIRSITNESDVEELMTEFGFQIINNSTLSPDQQAKQFSEADVIVGPHGAGLTNAIFLPEGSVVVELRPSDVLGRSPFWDRSDWALCHALGLQYGMICFPNGGDRDEWQIDVGHLRSTLRTLGW